MRRRIIVINDREKVEGVYKESDEYLQNHEELCEKIGTHLGGYYQVQTLIPQTIESFWSGHFFPYSESYCELENSFELCKQGYYRHSLFALRCALELGVIGLYFDKDDQACIDVQRWLSSEEPTPYFRKSLMRLFELHYFLRFNEKFALKEKIEELYSSLSNYVHVRGYRYSSRAQSRANFNQFNEPSLLRYVAFMKKIVKSVITMMLLKYPIGMQPVPLDEKFGLNTPMGGFLGLSEHEAVMAVLDIHTKQALQNISDSDPGVQEAVQHILSMPDLTEEQWQEQIVDFEENMKRQGIKWNQTNGVDDDDV